MSVSTKRPYVLPVIAGLLIVSGAMRFTLGAGPAIAFADDQIATEEVAVPSQEPNEDIAPLIAALQAREARLLEREAAIEDRLRALSLAEAELTERLQELQAAEESLTAAIAVSETANDADITRLVSVYENMKPGEAATLFEEMSPDFASGFLVRMRPEAAAAILAGLEPQTAYSISVIIAGRNANAPTQ